MNIFSKMFEALVISLVLRNVDFICPLILLVSNGKRFVSFHGLLLQHLTDVTNILFHKLLFSSLFDISAHVFELDSGKITSTCEGLTYAMSHLKEPLLLQLRYGLPLYAYLIHQTGMFIFPYSNLVMPLFPNGTLLFHIHLQIPLFLL